jgi:hypothetical protein
MKPPHWLCKHCGIIITDSGSEPVRCHYCEHQGFFYLGFEDEYDPIDVRAAHNIIYDPEKFSTDMKQRYWHGLSEEEKDTLQARIAVQAEQVKQRCLEEYNGEIEDTWARFERERNNDAESTNDE